MKKRVLVIIISILVSYNLFGQTNSFEKIKLKDRKLDEWEVLNKLFDTTISNYILHDDFLKKEQGVIVVRIISLNEKYCNYSISYIANRPDLYKIDCITNYFDFKGRLVLIQGGVYKNLLREKLNYDFFNEDVYFLDKYQNLTSPLERFILIEWYYVAVVNYKRNKCTISYFKNYNVDRKYSIWK